MLLLILGLGCLVAACDDTRPSSTESTSPTVTTSPKSLDVAGCEGDATALRLQIAISEPGLGVGRDLVGFPQSAIFAERTEDGVVDVAWSQDAGVSPDVIEFTLNFPTGEIPATVQLSLLGVMFEDPATVQVAGFEDLLGSTAEGPNGAVFQVVDARRRSDAYAVVVEADRQAPDGTQMLGPEGLTLAFDGTKPSQPDLVAPSPDLPGAVAAVFGQPTGSHEAQTELAIGGIAVLYGGPFELDLTKCVG